MYRQPLFRSLAGQSVAAAPFAVALALSSAAQAGTHTTQTMDDCFYVPGSEHYVSKSFGLTEDDYYCVYHPSAQVSGCNTLEAGACLVASTSGPAETNPCVGSPGAVADGSPFITPSSIVPTPTLSGWTVTCLPLKVCLHAECGGLQSCNQVAWYPDSDGDGFGSPTNEVLACAGDLPGGWVSNPYDCDDADPNVQVAVQKTFCPDADADGYYDPSACYVAAVCVDAPVPAGYVEPADAEADCDDSNPARHALFYPTYCSDADGDGHYDPSTCAKTAACQGVSPPRGLVDRQSAAGADCDDTNPAVTSYHESPVACVGVLSAPGYTATAVTLGSPLSHILHAQTPGWVKATPLMSFGRQTVPRELVLTPGR